MKLPLAGRTILIGVCGSIAAFRAADLVSRLFQAGAGVTVLMTRSARRFVTPLTFQTLSHRGVITGLWDPEATDPEHIQLARGAHGYLIAPATANVLGKLAGGIADDAVTTTALAVTCPLIVAPAMNTLMWEHPAVRANVDLLQRRGVIVVPPEAGRLACGTVGPGRLASTDRLYAAVTQATGAAGAGRLRKV